MTRAIIDTNTLIRALIKPQGTLGPVLTKYHLTDEDVETVLALILLRGEPVVPQRRITACRDPKDNVVLEVAVVGE